MEFWKGVGYQSTNTSEPGKCSCKHCSRHQTQDPYQDDLNSTKYPFQDQCNNPHHRFMPPTKPGFYDSYFPYCHHGEGGGFLTGVKTYAVSSMTGFPKTLKPTSDEEKNLPVIGDRRVGEILARLNYLASKNGLGIYELMKSLREDSLNEKHDKAEKKFQEQVAVALAVANAQNPPINYAVSDEEFRQPAPDFAYPRNYEHNDLDVDGNYDKDEEEYMDKDELMNLASVRPFTSPFPISGPMKSPRSHTFEIPIPPPSDFEDCFSRRTSSRQQFLQNFKEGYETDSDDSNTETFPPTPPKSRARIVTPMDIGFGDTGSGFEDSDSGLSSSRLPSAPRRRPGTPAVNFKMNLPDTQYKGRYAHAVNITMNNRTQTHH